MTTKRPNEDSDASPITIRRRHIDPSELTPKQLDRVLKNRQAAQASRERKRAYVTELEESRDLLEEEAAQLRERVMVLEGERSVLADEVSLLRAEFAELKNILLSTTSSADLQLPVRSHLSSVPSVPCVPTTHSLAPFRATRMGPCPTAKPAINVLHAAFSPFICTEADNIIHRDDLNLESRRLTQLPLSKQNHCVAGSERDWMKVKGRRMDGSLMASTSLPSAMTTFSG